MDKRVLNKGYTLVELLVVLSIISLFSILSFNNQINIDEDYYGFTYEYMFTKSIALVDSNKTSLDKYGIWFYDNGNVNKAMTINFDNGKKKIVELGYGVISEWKEALYYQKH